MNDDGWSDVELRSTWFEVAHRPDSELVAAAMRKAERTRGRLRAVRAVVALAAVGGLVAAVMHAVDFREAMTALAVGVAIVVSWVAFSVSERRQRDLLHAPAGAYVEARIALLRSQRRLLWFVCLVLALDLVFLGPWLASGIGIHLGEQDSARALLLLWFPLGILVVFAIWTVRRLRVIALEMEALQDAGEPPSRPA